MQALTLCVLHHQPTDTFVYIVIHKNKNVCAVLYWCDVVCSMVHCSLIVMPELINLLGREIRCWETAANLWHLVSRHKTTERMAENTAGSCKTWSPKNWSGMNCRILQMQYHCICVCVCVCLIVLICFVVCSLLLHRQLFDLFNCTFMCRNRNYSSSMSWVLAVASFCQKVHTSTTNCVN